MEIYHIVNHSISASDLFLDRRDYERFIRDMSDFNLSGGAGIRPDASEGTGGLVTIHAWCLMKDHYHLLLSENVPGGVNLFMRKLNIGYAKYFNKRHERSGFVFRGKTKKISVRNQSHALYILHYIHLNPLDYLPGATLWRERSKGNIQDTENALEYLRQYRWSSYLDYIGLDNFPSLLTRNLLRDDSKEYLEDVTAYLKDRTVTA